MVSPRQILGEVVEAGIRGQVEKVSQRDQPRLFEIEFMLVNELDPSSLLKYMRQFSPLPDQVRVDLDFDNKAGFEPRQTVIRKAAVLHLYFRFKSYGLDRVIEHGPDFWSVDDV